MDLFERGSYEKIIKLSLLYSQPLFILLLPVWFELTRYLHFMVIAILWFCFSFFVLFCICLIKDEKIIVSKRIFHLVVLLYSIGLLILLFFRPQEQNYGAVNLIPFETIQFYLSGQVDHLIAVYNLGANIGLFLPYGLYYRYIKKKPSIINLILIAIGSVCLIEGLQYISNRAVWILMI